MNPFDRLPRRNPRHRHGKRPVPMNPRGTLPRSDVPAQVPDAEERPPATRPAWLTEFRPAAQDDAGCPVCSDLEYGVRCTCREDCGHSLCLGKALADLRAKLAEAVPEPFAASTPDVLRAALNGLRALPDSDEPQQDDSEQSPVAWLRAIVPGRPELTEPLGRAPVFFGAARTASGVPVTGMYLGTNDDGWFVLDSVSPAWCEDAITALTAMRDALTGARDEAEEEGNAA